MTQESPSIEDLASGDLVLRLDHHDLARQIRPFLGGRTPVTAGYWLVNVLALALAVKVALGQSEVILGFSQVCLGMVLGYLVLLPLHESAHALAYRALGYRNVSIRYDWRRLTASCIADLQVVDARRFATVCLAPFLLLNPVLLAAAAASAGPVQALCAGALLLHIGACSGDVALLNILWLGRGRPLFTYDDQKLKETRFIALDR